MVVAAQITLQKLSEVQDRYIEDGNAEKSNEIEEIYQTLFESFAEKGTLLGQASQVFSMWATLSKGTANKIAMKMIGERSKDYTSEQKDAIKDMMDMIETLKTAHKSEVDALVAKIKEKQDEIDGLSELVTQIKTELQTEKGKAKTVTPPKARTTTTKTALSSAKKKADSLI